MAFFFLFRKDYLGAREGIVTKRTSCSSRGSRFDSQYSVTAQTPVPRDLIPCGLCRDQAYTYTDIQVGKTVTHIKKKKHTKQQKHSVGAGEMVQQCVELFQRTVSSNHIRWLITESLAPGDSMHCSGL